MLSALIGFAAISIIISFLCSLWEAVLLSISPSYMQIQLNEGGALGGILKQFKDNIDRPLAAILTLNTIAHTVGAIGVGQQATKIWAESNPVITGFVVPAAMTAAILILSVFGAFYRAQPAFDYYGAVADYRAVPDDYAVLQYKQGNQRFFAP